MSKKQAKLQAYWESKSQVNLTTGVQYLMTAHTNTCAAWTYLIPSCRACSNWLSQCHRQPPSICKYRVAPQAHTHPSTSRNGLSLNRKRESKKVRLLHMDCSCHAEHKCVFSYHCCTAKIWHQSTVTCSPTWLPNYSILRCTYFPKVLSHGALCDITHRKRTVNKREQLQCAETVRQISRSPTKVS